VFVTSGLLLLATYWTMNQNIAGNFSQEDKPNGMTFEACLQSISSSPQPTPEIFPKTRFYIWISGRR
jgi:hypothetical protein